MLFYYVETYISNDNKQYISTNTRNMFIRKRYFLGDNMISLSYYFLMFEIILVIIEWHIIASGDCLVKTQDNAK